MSTTNIQRLINVIEDALQQLGALYSLNYVEQLSILVHEAMTAPNRKFHSMEHIFDVMADEKNSYHVLAAIFHDIVYYNVDGGFTEQIDQTLKPYVEFEVEQFFIRKKALVKDDVYSLVNNVFGYKAGQPLLPFNGMNEYLSSLVAAKMLIPVIGVKNTMPIVACIEASIPFRKPNEDGKSCFHLLEERIYKLNQTKKWNYTNEQIDSILEISLNFANHDVMGFSDKQSAHFLDNTWKLLPESNPTLLTNKVYTIKKYRQALEKMEHFFNQIDPALIFHSYKNSPSVSEFERMQNQAKYNVAMGRLYLAGRLLSTSILEALSEVSGGDAPVVMFLGSNAKGNFESKHEFNALIRQAKVFLAEDVDSNVLSLFEFESNGSILDFRKTPLAGFVYKNLGTKKMLELILLAKKMFRAEVSAEQFLKYLGPQIVGPIANACACMISTRRDILQKWTA